MRLLRGRIGKVRRERAAADAPPREEAEQAEIDDQIAALREEVEADLGARDRPRDEAISSIVVVPNGRGLADTPARPRRFDRHAVRSISRTLAFWLAGLTTGAIVGVLVAYVM